MSGNDPPTLELPEQKSALPKVVEQKARAGKPQPAHLDRQAAEVSHVSIHGFPASDCQHDESKDHQTGYPAQAGEKGDAIHGIDSQENLRLPPDQNRTAQADTDEPEQHAPAEPQPYPGGALALYSKEHHDNASGDPHDVGLEPLRHVLQAFNRR